MARRERAATIGAARSRLLRQRISDEVHQARLASGLSIRQVARTLGVSPDRVARAERGGAPALTIDLAARMAAVLGLQLAASLYPSGDPVRDAAHLRLLGRFRTRLHRGLTWRTEVPIPIAGDLRSGDALITDTDWDALVEAETHLGDIQLIERRSSAKQRDLGAERLILLVADTRHNREVIRLHRELRERFPVDARTCLRELGSGRDPGGDCLLVL
jgi:transcriptional regulator with XRE-family HTH domain